jgi:hypothetical protein
MDRRTPALLAALAAVVSIAGCGASSVPAPRTALAPGAGGALPTTPLSLSRRLLAIDRALRDGVARWRARPGRLGSVPPAQVRAEATYVERAVELLSTRGRLAAATAAHLPPRLSHDVRDLTVARRDLRALSAGWPAHRVRTGPPTPLGRLVRSYRRAQERFGVDWRYLAAINLVESAFGRVRSRSVAGARGPMQFMPSTWRAYGLGGHVDNPGDAILGAANLLRRSGAPGDYARALNAYNPSRLYVDAVSRYARTIRRDPVALYLLYSWPPG